MTKENRTVIFPEYSFRTKSCRVVNYPSLILNLVGVRMNKVSLGSGSSPDNDLQVVTWLV